MGTSVYKQEYTITNYDVDVTSNLTLKMLLNIILLVSESQMESLGVGEDYLAKQSLGWVVTQYKMTIDCMPKMGDKITVSTRATSYNRYFAFREFWLTDVVGKERVHVKSIWVVMNRNTRKMISIPKDVIAPFNAKLVKIIPKLGRPMRLIKGEQLMEKQYRVRYFDIDQNWHVNNSHYFDWILDTLPMSFLIRNRLVALNIRFENEVKYHNDVISQATMVKNNQKSLITKHRIKLTDGSVSTETECHWKQIENRG